MITTKQLREVGSNLARLGPRRLALLGATGLAVMVSVVVAAQFLSRPAMQAIYTGLTAQDVGRMTAALAEAGLTFDVNEQRSAVLVPFGQTARARTLLAQKGLPTSSRGGYELFDQMGSMGLTSFMQEVTRVRALEGEIARTIQVLDGVVAARVHLVLPEAGSFRRDRRDPSASVVLRADSRWQPNTAHVVRQIVASAVPSLKIDQVSVVSTDGQLLVAGGDERAMGSQKLADMERAMALELEQRASRTLSSALGSGNFQISVTASLDIDRQQVNETRFDPKSRVERSMRVVRQSGSSEDAGARAAVGVEANVPREEGSQTDGERRRQRDDRKEELVNYELNSQTVQTVREGYRIKGLTVAVVVNRAQIEKNLGANADQVAVDQRLAEIKRLVSAATGIRSEREDRLEVSAIDFSAVGASLAPKPEPGLMDYVLMNIGTIVNAAAMVLIVMAVLLIGFRPVIKMLGQQPAALPAPQGAPAAISLGTGDALGKLEAADPAAERGTALESGGRSTDSRAMRGDMVRQRLNELVTSNDAKVARVLKDWMVEAKQA